MKRFFQVAVGMFDFFKKIKQQGFSRRPRSIQILLQRHPHIRLALVEREFRAGSYHGFQFAKGAKKIFAMPMIFLDSRPRQ